MVPWILFNRRPLPAVGSFLTIFLGGLLFFSVTWGAAWFLIPTIGRPLFTQWIRWGGLEGSTSHFFILVPFGFGSGL